MQSSPTKPLDYYRADIDGIRAIAVLAVIIFHINKTILPGGFIGVDIFFVISGYLITLHILRDLNLNRFSIVEFYRRRIKRIVPVMLVVVASVIIASLFIHRPEDTREVAKTSVAALLSVSNVYFWWFQDSSYFAPASNEIPLLHLWSLGVEEQFYIFWPLILMGCYRSLRGKHFFVLFLIVAALSFSLGQYLYPKFPSFAYYMLPTRVGELLVGALAAYVITKKTGIVIPSILVFLASIIGVVFIIASFIFLSEDVVFPGLYAIPPTIGAVLLILSGHYGNSWTTQLLTLRPLVFVGLISYSAYLWHWPLLSFARYSGLVIDFWNGISILILTFTLSTLSYYLVERPTRGYNGSAIKVIIYQYVFPASVLLVLSVLLYKTDGFFMHNNAEQYKLVAEQDLPAYKYDYVCQEWEITTKEINSADCVVGEITSGKHSSPHVLLWGDSNAAHYIGILGAFAQEARFLFRNLAHASCPPVFADPADFVSSNRIDKCRKSLQKMKQVIDDYKVIIISSDWTSYHSQSENFLPIFFKTVETLREKGKLVILLGKVPHVGSYDRICKEKAISIPFIKCGSHEKEKMSEGIAIMNTRLKNFASTTKEVEYFDVVDYICNNGLCSSHDSNGEPLYYDPSHLSMPASWKIGNEIIERTSGVPYPFTLINERLHNSKYRSPRENGL
jgi:peptidoglycan/LPS O-acetylase OafA/YrhL